MPDLWPFVDLWGMVNGNLFVVDDQEALLIQGLLHSSAFGTQSSGTADPGHYDHSEIRTHDLSTESRML